MNIKANLSQYEIYKRMLELAIYLADNDVDSIEIERNGIVLKFLVYDKEGSV